MEQKTKAPIQTKNKFALPKEGEIDEAIKIKKEAVQKVLNNGEAEARKENKSNPIAIGTSSPKKGGSTSAAK